jgi:phosphorylcholine metabolism protein LicD
MNRHEKYLLQMLEEIDSICKRNNIDYAVTGGTLIGAVRNGGSLPWDDDADIMMTRDNYLKFSEACRTQLPASRYLQDPLTCDNYWHLIPRYVRDDTTAIHTCQSLTDGDVCGEVIDIFVLDPVADGEEAYQRYLEDLYLYQSVVNYSNVAATRVELDPALCAEWLEKRDKEGRGAVAHELEERLARNFTDEGSYYVYRWQSVPYRLPRSWFASYTRVPFEGIQLSAPYEINRYLTNYFGENWEDVPGDIAPSKHNAAVSFDFPYTEALEYFEPKYDRAQLHKELDERKVSLLAHAPVDNALKSQRAEIKARAVEADLRATIAANSERFEQALAAQDGLALAPLLDTYLGYQVSKELIGRFVNGGMHRWMHPVLVNVDADVFEAALLVLLASNRLRFILRLKDIWLQKGRELTENAARICDAVEQLRQAMDYRFHDEPAKAIELLEPLTQRFPQGEQFWEELVMCEASVLKKSRDDNGLASFEKLIKTARTRFPQNGLFIKYEADRLKANGEEDAAEKRYLQAAEHTRNGIVLSEIARETGYYPTWIRNTDWAGNAGIPVWQGEEPEPLPKDAYRRETLASAPIDLRKDYLLGLLKELAAVCEEHGIPYVLDAELVETYLRTGELPGRESAYAIVVLPSGFKLLSELFETETADNRLFEYMLNTPSIKGLKGHYLGTDSLRISLKANTPQDHPYLRAGIRVVEKAIESADATPAKRGLFSRLMARASRKQSAPKSPRETFEELCSADPSGPYGVIGKKTGAQVNLDFFEHTKTLDLFGSSLRVPEDTGAYCAQLAPGDTPTAFEESPGIVYSASMNYPELLASGVMDDDFYSRKKAAWDANAENRDIMKKFRANFKQIKQAVARKQKELDEQNTM